MSDPGLRACGNELHHAALLPVSWAPRASGEDAALVARRLRRNLAALAVDAAGDERRERSAEDGGGSLELQRIDAKLNAIMELFALVLERELMLPARVAVRFNACGAEWNAPEPPPKDHPIVVRIHLEACPALPLELAATVMDSPEHGWAAARFEAVRPPVGEAIARLVFREHRRQVADSIGTQK